MARQNVTLSELRQRFKDEVMKSKLVRHEVGLAAAITPSEVRNYYDTHKDEFMSPEKASVLNISIKTGENGRAKEDARLLIERIKDLVDKGGDFKELAMEYSEGPNAKDGGDMG